MKYRGFEIKNEQSHYVVISLFPPSIGMEEWREDTVEDAKREIDEFWDNLTRDTIEEFFDRYLEEE